MTGTHSMKRLFDLYLIFLKTNNVRDKITLKKEIDLLHQQVIKEDTIPYNVKNTFNEILNQHRIISHIQQV